MTHKHGDAYSTPIAEMRRLVRSQFDNPTELETLRNRIAAQRRETRATMTKLLADRLGGEFESLFEEQARKREELRREVVATMERLEAAASERAGREGRRFHAIART
jgi:hypothetical protein